MEKHITPMTELKQRWASMRAAFADHVYESSEPNLPVPFVATARPDLSGVGNTAGAERNGGGQTFTDEQAIALLSMGLSDLSGGVEKREVASPYVPETKRALVSQDAPFAQIITSPNGIFAGTVIGVKASVTKDGITHVAFGPDAKTASNRLRERIT